MRDKKIICIGGRWRDRADRGTVFLIIMSDNAVSKEGVVLVVLIPLVFDHHLLPTVQLHIRKLKSRHLPRFELIGSLLLGKFVGVKRQSVVSGEDGGGIEAEVILLGTLE